MIEDFIKIFLALLLGGMLGAERGKAGKAAGLRTYILVTVAATAFTIISKEANTYFESVNYDPGRLLSQVVVGIGFIGAGIIIYQREHIKGLTTAAGLWIATAIGMLVGIGAYFLAILLTLISYITLAYFIKIEDVIEGE